MRGNAAEAKSGSDDKWAAYASRPHFYNEYKNPKLYYFGLAGMAGTYCDIGAGDGANIDQVIGEGALNTFSQIAAIDISSERIDRLKRRLPQVLARVGNALNLPMQDSSVDFAFSDQVIEHVDDDGAMVREIRRVLKPGGRAVVGSVIKGKGAWYFYRCNGEWRLDPTHVREYDSLDSYSELFKREGLEILETEVLNVSFSFASLFRRLLLALHLLKNDMNINSKLFLNLRLRIPNYYLCYVLVEKRS